jgi:phenylalanyl-tRNA synthetase alpha chain
MGVPPTCGHLHPLLKVRSEFRDIFFQMGFSEMPTNRFVESSFWNFDALFQPQQHPARDAHDTFFLKGFLLVRKLVFQLFSNQPISEPAISTKFPEDYLERVKKVHSEGGYGSIGYMHLGYFQIKSGILVINTIGDGKRPRKMFYGHTQQQCLLGNSTCWHKKFAS